MILGFFVISLSVFSLDINKTTEVIEDQTRAVFHNSFLSFYIICGRQKPNRTVNDSTKEMRSMYSVNGGVLEASL